MTTTDSVREAEVVVLGGGPAGATVATLLADRGHDVLLLERETFPRFAVGESLIPATYGVLDRLGMLPAMRASRFPEKHSVQFFSGDGRASAPFYFAETDPSERSRTWQVLRSEFDVMMLANARRHGARAFEGATVREVVFADDAGDGEPRAVGVRVRLPGDEATRDVRCRVVVDTTGRRAVLARQLGLRRPDPRLQMATIFTHVAGAHRDAGRDEGATLILDTAGRRSWFWSIPLPDDLTSIGVVGPVATLIQGRQGDPQGVFDEELQRCPGLLPRLAGARQVRPVQVLNDFSYTATRAAGPGWVLAGDALGFLDPVYSTGLLLALASGEMAADCVTDALAADDLAAARLGAFEERFRAGMASFRGLVYAFYDPDFSFAGFLRRHPEHRLAIVDILVGDVMDRDFSALFADMAATKAEAAVAG